MILRYHIHIINESINVYVDKHAHAFSCGISTFEISVLRLHLLCSGKSGFLETNGFLAEVRSPGWWDLVDWMVGGLDGSLLRFGRNDATYWFVIFCVSRPVQWQPTEGDDKFWT